MYYFILIQLVQVGDNIVKEDEKDTKANSNKQKQNEDTTNKIIHNSNRNSFKKEKDEAAIKIEKGNDDKRCCVIF